MFEVGQKVVCVKRVSWMLHANPRVLCPNVGQVLTIRSMQMTHCGRLGLRFEEIVNPPRDYAEGFQECCFLKDGFRPVTRTSIAIFQAMLAPQPKETVDA